MDLKINTKVGIKDNLEQEVKTNEPFEIHYQNLRLFDINKFIVEEIYLNFPSIVLCCGSGSNKNKDQIKKQKIRPFKKIKDLIG